jgi:hypothetical protein
VTGATASGKAGLPRFNRMSIPPVQGSQEVAPCPLAATTDFRDVFQEVARAQFGISESLFPGYTPGPGVGVVA